MMASALGCMPWNSPSHDTIRKRRWPARWLSGRRRLQVDRYRGGIIPALIYFYGMSQIKAQETSIATLLLLIGIFAF